LTVSLGTLYPSYGSSHLGLDYCSNYHCITIGFTALKVENTWAIRETVHAKKGGI
jgi:hypothetical protein